MSNCARILNMSESVKINALVNMNMSNCARILNMPESVKMYLNVGKYA